MFKIPDLPDDGEVFIRKASMGDAIAVRAIAESSGIDAWTVDQYRQETQSKESIVLVAVNNGTTVGFILGRIVPGNVAVAEGEIYNIAVADQAKRKGFGRMLLARVVENFMSRGCECVWLEVRSSNSAAIQFYEHNGFSRSAVRRNFYSNPVEDALIMRLDLTGTVPT